MALARIDAFPIEAVGDELSDDTKKWLTNLVDTLNSILEDIDAALVDIDTRLTNCGC